MEITRELKEPNKPNKCNRHNEPNECGKRKERDRRNNSFLTGLVLGIALLFCTASLSDAVESEDIFSHFQPYITIEEDYDSNLFLTQNNEKDDFITIISPGFRLSTLKRSPTTGEFGTPASTEETKYGIDFNVQAPFVFYAKDTADEYAGLLGKLDAWYTSDRRLNFRVKDYAIRSDDPREPDYSVGALPGEYILGTARGQRAIYFRNLFQPYVEYQFGRESQVSLYYTNNLYRNESSLYEDSTENYINPRLDYWFDIRNGVSLEYGLTLGDFETSPDLTGQLARGRYTHRFNPRTSVFGDFRFLARDFDPQISQVNYDVYVPTIGGEHAFSRTLTLRAQLGYYWEEQERGPNDSGPVYDILLTQRAQRTTYNLLLQGGFTEDYFSAENLGFAEYHRIVGSVTHQLLQRVSLTFLGAYERPDYKDGRTDNIWRVGGNMTYQPVRWLSLAVGGGYEEDHSNQNVYDYNVFRTYFRVTGSY